MTSTIKSAVCVACMAVPGWGYAQAQGDIDAAKLRADYAAQLQREAEARKAIAEADAASASAAERAKAASQKIAAEADKASADYIKGLLPTAPDPSKYKVAVPGVPQVAATASEMTFDDVEKISSEISTALFSVITKETTKLEKKPTCKATILFADAGKFRNLLSLYRATSANLQLAKNRIDRITDSLKQQTAPSHAVAPGVPSFLPSALVSLGEVAASFATILKTQYAYGGASVATLADEIITAKTMNKLQSQGETLVWLDPENILTVVDIDNPSAEAPKLVKELQGLKSSISDARLAVKAAAEEVAKRRKNAPKPKDDKDKAGAEANRKALNSADELEKAAKDVTATADEADKGISVLFTVDSQGSTVFDTSLRGGILNERLAGACSAFAVATKAVASNYDTIAADGLFRGLRVSVSSQTIVTYRLTKSDGQVVLTGAAKGGTPLRRIALPN